ncbi:hypothetical protein DKL61_08270 [Gammaproteobacteria bacterium ESL0073]|nr:hypothetical protein DKL61_08270 [Gammaproteobacteria bacterium ESL0073]
MNNSSNLMFFKVLGSLIIKYITHCFQVIYWILQAINFFIFRIKIRIVFTYKDVFIVKGGTRREHVYHHLVNTYNLLKTRSDAVIRKCSHSLQREPRIIVRDKDYPSSAAKEISSHLLIHRFDLMVKLEVVV